jgi:tripartite-type tricarboxylate transporter receptor subunit TctC
MRNRKQHLLAALVMSVVTNSGYAADAGTYPIRPIRFVVPFPGGGSYDVIARLLANGLSDRLGQQVVIDNRPGAGGLIGTELFINAPADGYTIGMFGNPQTIAATMNPNFKWDLSNDITPIATLANLSNVVVVNPSVPAKSVKELIQLAKDKPGTLNYASGGVGATSHLAGELLKHTAGIELVHVPYKGAAAALTDLLSGRVQVMVLNMVVAMPNIQSGKVRALAVASPSRSPFLPDVPSATEAGVPGFEFSQWYSVVGPSGLPTNVVSTLYREIDATRRSKQFSDGLVKQGAEPFLADQQSFAAYITADVGKYRRLVKESGIVAASK